MVACLLEGRPLADRLFLTAAAEMFPFRNKPLPVLHDYTLLLLELALELPHLTRPLLRIVFEKLLLIDTETSDSDPSEKNRDLLTKMDALSALLLSFLGHVLKGQPGPFETPASPQRGPTFLKILLEILVKQVLVVQESSFLPMLYLHLCALDSKACEYLFTILLKVSLREEHEAEQIVYTAIAFLNAILKRSTAVPPHVVQGTFVTAANHLLQKLALLPPAPKLSSLNLRLHFKQHTCELTWLQLLLNITERYPEQIKKE
jgi:hypothetical protein